MRCPVCGSERLALAALPGEQPGDLRVCLACAHLWTQPVELRDHPRS